MVFLIVDSLTPGLPLGGRGGARLDHRHEGKTDAALSPDAHYHSCLMEEWTHA